MGKTEYRAPEAANHVEVWGLGSKRHGSSGEGGAPIEPGSPQAGAGQKMGQRFQDCSLLRIHGDKADWSIDMRTRRFRG